jgi:hypothetical protein
MKKYTLLLLMAWLTNTVNAQDTIAVFKRANSFLVGLSSATRPAYFDSDNNYVFQVGGSARIGYFPQPKIAIIGEYSKYGLVGNIINDKYISTARVVGRYYWNGIRSGTYTDLGYLLSDSRIFKSDGNSVNVFPSHYLTLTGGLSIKIIKNLYVDLSYHAAISLNGKDTKSYFDRHIGIDYIFNNKYADIPTRKRSKLKESEDLGKRKFQIATGIFFFPFSESSFGERYNEFLSTSKFGYYLTKNITFGLMTGLIYAKPETKDARFFYFVGPYLNYKIIPHEKISMYLETGYNYSNHSIPEEGLPRNSTTHYLNYGCGINYKINNDFYIDAGLVLQGCVGGTEKCEGGASILRLGTEFVIR